LKEDVMKLKLGLLFLLITKFVVLTNKKSGDLYFLHIFNILFSETSNHD